MWSLRLRNLAHYLFKLLSYWWFFQHVITIRHTRPCPTLAQFTRMHLGDPMDRMWETQNVWTTAQDLHWAFRRLNGILSTNIVPDINFMRFEVQCGISLIKITTWFSIFNLKFDEVSFGVSRTMFQFHFKRLITSTAVLYIKDGFLLEQK